MKFLFWLKQTQIDAVIICYSNNNDSLPKNFIHQLSKTQDKAECNRAQQGSGSESLDFFLFLPCTWQHLSERPTVKRRPGGGAGLCRRRALGARVEGWLSEALIQERAAGGHTWRQELRRQRATLTHSLTRCKHSCWLCATRSRGTRRHKVWSAERSSAFGSPAYSHHVTVLVVVGFADFLWKRQKK